MRSAILDTNILIDLLDRSDLRVADAVSSLDELLLTPVVIGEYLAGIRPGKNGDKAKAVIENLLDDVNVRFLWMTKATGKRYAEIFQQLKSKGTPIPANDIWIAASAIENDVAILTKDAHFKLIDNLRLAGDLIAQEGAL